MSMPLLQVSSPFTRAVEDIAKALYAETYSILIQFDDVPDWQDLTPQEQAEYLSKAAPLASSVVDAIHSLLLDD